MLFKTYPYLILIFILTSSWQGHAQRNYLQNGYNAAGGKALLSGISQWRIKEKEAILTGISTLPTAVKQELIAAGDRSLAQPWPLIRLSDYREFKEIGNRVNFEGLYLGRRTKLSILCAAELASGEGKYLKEIANGIWLMLEETSWVLPAHHYGANVTDDPNPETPTIDLFAAETAAHLAWAKLLLGEQLYHLSPTLIKRLDAELNTRIFKPYMATDDYWWMGLNTTRRQNNWNIWINSNLLKTAVIMDDDSTRRAAMVTKLIQSADKFLNVYPEDGGCDEGPAYWGAAGGCLGEFLGILTRLTSHQLTWNKNELIRNIGNYIYKVHVSGARFVNFADAPGFSLPDAGRVFNFGEMFDDIELKSFAAYVCSINGSSSGYLGYGSINTFANTARISKELIAVKAHAPMPKQNWLPDLQVVNLRPSAGSNKGLTFMAKGGHNNESHNHNDVGNFMLYQDGEPVLIDLGKGTYTKQTFSPDRYKLWYIQSQWHNCPLINGIDQQAGASFKATNVNYRPGENTIFSMDLAAAYPASAGVKQWKREFRYQHSASVLTIKETYNLDKYIAPTALSFVACKLPIQEKEGAIRLFSYAGKAAQLMEYDPAIFEAKIAEQLVNDGSLASVWGNSVYRITLTLKSKNLKGNYSINFR